ncbi:gluconate 2-dehydrogenase subunit 3 family protein [Chitiniphilus purpureus]|uniref:Gluconate 2-dehydrogenase subunit 3 family protein n=1 Tax=Chitiniphilus purpureus TaxID=2981137 RepID=A0ABY6DRZ3_9NEIS|nr:gluconate 2-dehydrogenase subunit 3 family protein [Chitiniphilus sp. CD1]UXY17134.1 gluconate 2-dehydrogenase subunit 3 family protein [Chitiniphilus sp. CD1]
MTKATSLSDLMLTRRHLLKGVTGMLASFLAMPALSAVLAKADIRKHRKGRRALDYPCQPPGPDTTPAVTPAFTPAEVAVITRLVHLILPTDATAGAAQTGTAEAVVYTLSLKGPDTIAGLQQAIAVIDATAQQQYGQPYAQLPDDAAQAMTAAIAASEPLAPFWGAVRSLAVLHFYAQPAGYEPLGMPGPSIDRGGFPDGRPGSGNLCTFA